MRRTRDGIGSKVCKARARQDTGAASAAPANADTGAANAAAGNQTEKDTDVAVVPEWLAEMAVVVNKPKQKNLQMKIPGGPLRAPTGLDEVYEDR